MFAKKPEGEEKRGGPTKVGVEEKEEDPLKRKTFFPRGETTATGREMGEILPSRL